jgi:hypothetical protein
MDWTTNNRIGLTLNNKIPLRINLFCGLLWQISRRPVYNARSFSQQTRYDLILTIIRGCCKSNCNDIKQKRAETKDYN